MLILKEFSFPYELHGEREFNIKDTTFCVKLIYNNHNYFRFFKHFYITFNLLNKNSKLLKPILDRIEIHVFEYQRKSRLKNNYINNKFTAN